MAKFILASMTAFWLTGSSILSAFIFGPGIETRFFPVTSRIDLEIVREHEGGVDFTFTFEKLRQCELVPNSFLVLYGGTFKNIFTPIPTGERREKDLPSGEAFQSRVWTVKGLTSDQLKGSRMVWEHWCHPFWKTITDIYP